MVRPDGLEPSTPALYFVKLRCSRKISMCLWAWMESNHRLPPYKGGTLTAELQAPRHMSILSFASNYKGSALTTELYARRYMSILFFAAAHKGSAPRPQRPQAVLRVGRVVAGLQAQM